jgi:Fe-S oxidoreductase
MNGGTMCPSYRATRDERHATRGRGNALRLAVTGQFNATLGSPSWNDPETLQTLDLCLSCKACKSECPSNVDLAKMKAEYLAQSYDARGRVPLRSSMFGRVRPMSALGSRFPLLANAALGNSLVRRALQAAAGIDRRRSLPRFEPSLRAWFDRTATSRRSAGPAVILYADCFTMYNEPHIGRAAVNVLDSLGYRVLLQPDASARIGCCGRSLISMGMLSEAIQTITSTAAMLASAVAERAAVAIVGCEPSCVSAIVDDWQDLALSTPRETVRGVGQRTQSIEDFIESRWGDHPVNPPAMATGPSTQPILLHGHCHQKALWGTAGTASLLTRFFGSRVRSLESGCCGMAGSFGYTTDHYDLSMHIGEQSLFSKIRGFENPRVLAPGTSCRHQVRDGMMIEAAHPVEILAETLLTPRPA